MILEIGKTHCQTPMEVIEIQVIKENPQVAGKAPIIDKAQNNMEIRPTFLLKMKIQETSNGLNRIKAIKLLKINREINIIMILVTIMEIGKN